MRPGLQERTILVNGVSKAYAMTGWRIGWTLSPANVATAMADLQSQETSNPCSISQYAALAALRRPAGVRRRRCWPSSPSGANSSAGGSPAFPGLSCPDMAGAFYAFINIKAHLGRNYGGTRVDNSTQWCLALLEQQNVATVMGSAFGAEGYARISFATSLDTLAGRLRSHRGVFEERSSGIDPIIEQERPADERNPFQSPATDARVVGAARMAAATDLRQAWPLYRKGVLVCILIQILAVVPNWRCPPSCGC